jgi:hypothetical protein
VKLLQDGKRKRAAYFGTIENDYERLRRLLDDQCTGHAKIVAKKRPRAKPGLYGRSKKLNQAVHFALVPVDGLKSTFSKLC